jgi:hypothetical protein
MLKNVPEVDLVEAVCRKELTEIVDGALNVRGLLPVVERVKVEIDPALGVVVV